jgi:hypothetical protein
MSCPENKLKTKSGAPWSTRAAVVRDAHGTIVKDATKLADGVSVTVVPVWADGGELAQRFTVRDVVAEGRERLAEGAEKPGPNAELVHVAVWRSQGGTKDAYSVLPTAALRATLGALGDEELSEALAWSSNRDFERLERFARNDEHRKIVEARSRVKSESLQESGADRSLALRRSSVKWSEESITERERLRNALRGELQQVAGLSAGLRSGARDVLAAAEAIETRARKMQVSCHDAEQGVQSVASHRDGWLEAVMNEIGHDEALVELVRGEAGRLSEVKRAELQSTYEVSDALGYVRSRMQTFSESVRRGDREGAERAIRNVIESLEQADQTLVRGIVSSREVHERLSAD